MAKSIEIPEEVMAEIRKHEVKYTVIEEFAEPVKHFADWTCRYDKLIARVQLADGSEGYLGKGNLVGMEYLTTMDFSVSSKKCSKSNVMLKIDMFSTRNGRKFNVREDCKIISSAVSRYQKQRHYRNNSSRVKRQSSEYYSKHKGMKRVGGLKRRCPDMYSDERVIELVRQSMRVCLLTRFEGTSIQVELEHIMPVSISRLVPYGNSETNCYYLLGSLNRSKGNKNIFDWIDSMSQSHLQFLLEDYPVDLSLQEFREGMFKIITGLAEKQGLIFDQYKEQYNKDYAEGLHEKAC